jgi:hypothetical protein
VTNLESDNGDMIRIEPRCKIIILDNQFKNVLSGFFNLITIGFINFLKINEIKIVVLVNLLLVLGSEKDIEAERNISAFIED